MFTKKSAYKRLASPVIKNHERQLLIISDLDGSLLNDEGKLSKETINVVKEVSKKGHLFCIATGRTPRGSIEIYKQLNLNTILVNLNGAYIWHPNNSNFMPINIVFDKLLIKRLISQKDIMKRIENIIIENKEGTYILKKPVDKEEILAFDKIFHIDIYSDKNIFFGIKEMLSMVNDPNAILLQIKNPNYIDDITYSLKENFNTFVVRSWSLPNTGSIIEVNTTYANKGNAVDFLESYYGIQKDSTIGFGDGENDVELIQKVRFGYAMKNGSSSVKLVARYITEKTNENNGIALELLKKVLRK